MAALAKLSRISSSISSPNKLLLRALFVQPPSYSTATKSKYVKNPKPSPFGSEQEELGLLESSQNPQKESIEWPRPTEIPWQVKVANSIHLIGSIENPVNLEVSPDGDYRASALLVQKTSKDLPHFRIPIIFEGDLAQIAVFHLKKSDYVYVTGHVSGTPEEGQRGLQVMVQNINFVQKICSAKKTNVCEKEEQIFELSAKPLTVEESKESAWIDLTTNSKQWQDNRMDKSKGLINKKYPDFTHKETRQALWLNTAPKWIYSKLEGLEFAISQKKKQENSELPTKKTDYDELWKNLVENPGGWWDNRANKLYPKSPDFKKKVTGEGLWLGPSTPAWALSNLPPATPTAYKGTPSWS